MSTVKVITAPEQAAVRWVEDPRYPRFGRNFIVAKDGRAVGGQHLTTRRGCERIAKAKGLPFDEVSA